MERIISISADGEGLPMLLRDYLKKIGLSTSTIKEAKRGAILLNGERVTVRALINSGDLLEIFVPKETSETIEAMDIPISVLYEDEDILAVDKPTNMPTHPSKGNNLPTLANAVMGYYGGDFVFRSVNRLDRDTSGIVIIAKNKISASALSASMKRGEWKKIYHAKVDGTPKEKSGVIDAPIERISEGNIKREVRYDGKRAITEYKVLEETENYSLVELRLKTGRTHQIRVHMAHIGHALVSDFLYGIPSEEEYYLRCKEISFPHPQSGKFLTIKA